MYNFATFLLFVSIYSIADRINHRDENIIRNLAADKLENPENIKQLSRATLLNVGLAFNYGLINEWFNLKTLCSVCLPYLMFIFHGLPHIATGDSGVIKAGNDGGTRSPDHLR